MPAADVVPMPPLDLIRLLSGSGSEDDYRATGQLFRRLLLNPGGLKPTDRVLDVGCGIGRMAVALADHIAPPGSYDGFDIAPAAIHWCHEHVTPRWPHFRFHHADVFNAMYNPTSRVRARAYRFPYPSGTFDHVFLTSVFTHLLPADAAHYLAEVARVLKPGGRVFATFFLLHQERLERVRAGGMVGLFRDMRRYKNQPLAGGEPVGYGDCFYHDPQVLEAAVGYDRQWVTDQIRACGLTADATIYYGDWCGHPSEWDGQDVICATKTGTPAFGHRLKKAMRLDGLREWLWRRTKK